MNKESFLNALAHALRSMPRRERKDTLAYYAEMIDERIEGGASPQEAVEALGSIEEIAAQLGIENAGEQTGKSGGAMRIVLMSLLLCVSAIVTVVMVALGGGTVVGVFGSVYMLNSGNMLHAIMLLGAGFVCAGVLMLIIPFVVGATKRTRSQMTRKRTNTKEEDIKA